MRVVYSREAKQDIRTERGHYVSICTELGARHPGHWPGRL